MDTGEFTNKCYLDIRGQDRGTMMRLDNCGSVIEMSVSGRDPRECFGDKVNNIKLGHAEFKPIYWYPERGRRITIYFGRVK